ncbi:MAG: hypothetical protein ACLGH8_15695 [Bacteroidia bacterium]
MNYFKILAFAGLCLLVVSCKDDEKLRIIETQRAQKVNDSILKVISNNWHFDVAPPTPKVAQRLSGWNEWEQFNNELHQKPTSTLEAFRRKSKVLVTKADLIRNNIPQFFDKPQVRARLGVVITKIKMIYTYMSIELIPDKKIIELIGDVTRELDATQQQLDEIIRYSEIPKEEGEQQMLQRALDTTRLANPDAMMPPQAQQLTPAPQANPTPGTLQAKQRFGKRNNQ